MLEIARASYDEFVQRVSDLSPGQLRKLLWLIDEQLDSLDDRLKGLEVAAEINKMKRHLKELGEQEYAREQVRIGEEIKKVLGAKRWYRAKRLYVVMRINGHPTSVLEEVRI